MCLWCLLTHPWHMAWLWWLGDHISRSMVTDNVCCWCTHESTMTIFTTVCHTYHYTVKYRLPVFIVLRITKWSKIYVDIVPEDSGFRWFSLIFVPQVHPQNECYLLLNTFFKWKLNKCVINLELGGFVIISSLFKILYYNCSPWQLHITFLFLKYFETKVNLKKMNLKRNPEKTGGKPRNLKKHERYCSVMKSAD